MSSVLYIFSLASKVCVTLYHKSLFDILFNDTKSEKLGIFPKAMHKAIEFTLLLRNESILFTSGYACYHIFLYAFLR